MAKLGRMTQGQASKAHNFTSQIVRFCERRNTGDISVSELRPNATFATWDAERVIEFQMGDLAFAIDIHVKRHDR